MVHYRSADTSGHRVFYREAGALESPAVLLLHGFPTSSHMFRELIPRLADRPGPRHTGATFPTHKSASSTPATSHWRRTSMRLQRPCGASSGRFSRTPHRSDFSQVAGGQLPSRIWILRSCPIEPLRND